MNKQELIDKLMEKVFDLRSSMQYESNTKVRAGMDMKVHAIYEVIAFIQSSNDKSAIIARVKSLF